MRGKYFRIRRARQENRKIAMERVRILKKIVDKDPNGPFAKRYKELIRRISRKYRLEKGF